MSDEPASSPDTSSPAPVEPAPRVRRISNPRPKKAAKTAKVADEASAAVVESPASSPAAAPSPVEPVPSPVSASSEEARENGSSQENDWPEPEPAQTGGGSQESGKRKRRRRKGKGQSSGGPANAGPGGDGEHQAPPVAAESKPADFKAAEPKHVEPRPNPPQGGGFAQPQQQRQRFDPELISKLALKIYLAEVSEEGVALIGDNDAKELSRRCFRLAEIFIEEQSRRR